MRNMCIHKKKGCRAANRIAYVRRVDAHGVAKRAQRVLLEESHVDGRRYEMHAKLVHVGADLLDALGIECVTRPHGHGVVLVGQNAELNSGRVVVEPIGRELLAYGQHELVLGHRASDHQRLQMQLDEQIVKTLPQHTRNV